VAFVQGFDGVNAWGSVNGAVVGVEGKKLDELRAQIDHTAPLKGGSGVA
jgi:hypothetical protein